MSKCGLGFFVLLAGWAVASTPRPNMLWITAEDIGPHWGCYGDAYARTPNIDALAARGLRYRTVWATAPVCAPARTAIIAGMYPSALGAEHMRSEVAPPPWLRMYPQLLREAGYYCSNNSKEDYNLSKPGRVWDDSSARAHYRNRAAGQPFFAVFNYTMTHESAVRRRPHTWRHDVERAPVPPYHPNTLEVRQDWAQYYDNITDFDAKVGEHLRELEAEGLGDETIVMVYGDHGPGLPRCKRWPYDSGLRVGLVVYIPEKFWHLAPPNHRPGDEVKRLVSFVDLAPTVLSLAGVRPPDWMQGRAFLGPHTAEPTECLFGLRGRMDERIDMVRAVRTSRHVYLRHYHPHRIYGEYLDYMFQTPTTRIWKQLYDAGRLESPAQRRFWEPKPCEELYDLEVDPHETVNLADSAAHRHVLQTLRGALRRHVMEVRDVGYLPEAEVHRRAAASGKTIGDFARDPVLYPLERIFDAAELAACRDEGSVPRLAELLADADSGVRYWAAVGFCIRGRAAVRVGRDALRGALADESPSVRIAAAEALARFGEGSDRPAAIAVLAELMSPRQAGVYAAIEALNALSACGEAVTGPLRASIAALPLTDPNAPARANGYIARLVEYLTGERRAAP
ncbi:MAG: sulfatase-like hydrolase/transferase [Kiritimatiellae bacterium]|nr:sulfatase-like hydrolase/transferase [Kiritimatiellia bacterium]